MHLYDFLIENEGIYNVILQVLIRLPLIPLYGNFCWFAINMTIGGRFAPIVSYCNLTPSPVISKNAVYFIKTLPHRKPHLRGEIFESGMSSIKKTFEIAYEMSTNAKIPYIFRRHFVGRFEDDVFYG